MGQQCGRRACAACLRFRFSVGQHLASWSRLPYESDIASIFMNIRFLVQLVE